MKKSRLRISSLSIMILLVFFSTLFLSSSANSQGYHVTTIYAGGAPWFPAYDPANKEMYVSNPSSGNLTVINSTTNEIVANISVGGEPRFLAYDPANEEMFVAAVSNLFVISAANHVKSLGVPAYSLAYDPADKMMYTTQNDYVINSTNDVVATLSVGGQFAPTYDPASETMYFANAVSPGNISVISGTTVVATLDVSPYPLAGVYDPANQQVYIANYLSNAIYAINGSSNKILCKINVTGEPNFVSYDPANREIFVPNNEIQGNVSVISGSTNTIIKTIKTGNDPYYATYDPSNKKMYVVNIVSCCADGSVSVINSNNKLVATIQVGHMPLFGAYDKANGQIYVPDFSDGGAYNNGTISAILYYR